MPRMAREISAVAPILPAAEEEHLDRGVAAGLVHRHHVGVAQPVEIDVLAALHLRERADAVAHGAGALVFAPVGELLHAGREPALHLVAAAG